MNSQDKSLRVVLVSDETVWSLHGQLSRKEIDTRGAQRWLDRHAETHRATPPFVQIPMPLPVGNNAALRLYLRVWLHLRSPTFGGYHHATFRTDASVKVLALCIEHIGVLAAIQKHEPRLKPAAEFNRYFKQANALLASHYRMEVGVRMG